ncbi:MAG: hypothetical protein LBG24_04840 [Treponema sp.]|jgi:hypothetical protein|nr:hypothetical protein [Treponema sp.]
MIKNKFSMWKVLGLITFVLVLLVSACDNGSSENTDPDPKVLKITNVGTAGTGGFMVGMFSEMPEEGEPENEISGFGRSSNGVATIELKVGNPQTGPAWTGTGSYYVNAIDTTEGGLIYLYTNGEETVGENYSNVTKVNFSGTVTTLSLDKFASMENDLE